MRISGFTFCRNALRYDYPVVESIRSILPIVDELVVNVGRCDDGTLERIRSIGDPKIRVVESVWDETLRKDGLIYSQQTNIALSHCTGDWAFYLQADEVIHEGDLPQILEAVALNHRNPAVRGCSFVTCTSWGITGRSIPGSITRRSGSFATTGKWNRAAMRSGFHLKATGQYLQSGPPEWLAFSGARVFHYGWVKDPKIMLAKKQEQTKVYHGDSPPRSEAKLYTQDTFDFEDYSILKDFSREPSRRHAYAMVAGGTTGTRRNRWLNWRFYREVVRRGFRG